MQGLIEETKFCRLANSVVVIFICINVGWRGNKHDQLN